MSGSTKILLLLLLTGSTPLYAQTQAPPPPSKSPSTPAVAGEQKTPAPHTPPAAEASEKKSTNAGAGKDSPFDYRASEQISEDLPVSFPVDI